MRTQQAMEDSMKARGSSKAGKRATVLLCEGLEKRMFAYVLAAGAGMAAAPATTEAKIVYTPASTTITGGVNYNPCEEMFIDLNHDGVFDFGFGACSIIYSGTLAQLRH